MEGLYVQGMLARCHISRFKDEQVEDTCKQCIHMESLNAWSHDDNAAYIGFFLSFFYLLWMSHSFSIGWAICSDRHRLFIGCQQIAAGKFLDPIHLISHLLNSMKRTTSTTRRELTSKEYDVFLACNLNEKLSEPFLNDDIVTNLIDTSSYLPKT